jgi:hypothetical protein
VQKSACGASRKERLPPVKSGFGGGRGTCPPFAWNNGTHSLAGMFGFIWPLWLSWALCCSFKGAVTLSKEEREKRAARILSSGRDCRAPYVHRRRAKGSVLALNIESIVGGCVG